MTKIDPYQQKHLVLIDYYQGAYGPTIRIGLRSLSSAVAIRNLFAALAKRKTTEVRFHEVELVRISGLSDLILQAAPGENEPEKTLSADPVRAAEPEFYWVRSSSGWMECVDLMDGLIRAGTGHQYLTKEGIDDALVEVSLLE